MIFFNSKKRKFTNLSTFDYIQCVFSLQALLGDSSFEDSHWPPELVLLREKFTAKSQLEIAQLQLKHEEEVRPQFC